MTSSGVVALNCPGCGAALRVEQQAETHACRYCGVTLRVDHAQGAISLSLVADAVAGVQRGTDRTAAELAIRRLSEDLKTLEREQAELRSYWEDEDTAWSRAERLAAQAKGPGQGLVQLVVGIVAFFVASFVFTLLSVALFPAELHMLLVLLSFGGAFAVAGLVIRRSPSLLYAKHRRQAVAVIQERRDDALAAQDTQEREVQGRINLMKKKLQANLLIADS